MANLSGMKKTKETKNLYPLDCKNSQWNFGSLVRDPDLAFHLGRVKFMFNTSAIVRLIGIEANVLMIKEGLFRHHSACFSSHRQRTPPTRCPSDEPDLLLKDSDFTRSQPMCFCSSFVPLRTHALPPRTTIMNSSHFWPSRLGALCLAIDQSRTGHYAGASVRCI